MRILLRLGLVAVTAGVLTSCAADAPVAAAAVCRSEPGPESGLRVNAVSDAYFYADAPGGAQAGYALGGGVVPLEPGEYVARLNNTRQPVTVEGGQVTTCETATIDVAGTTSEYWYLLDTLSAQLGYSLLDGSLGVFPGRYTIRVNNTHQSVTADARNTVSLATGTIRVAGATSEYFYVLDQNGQQLAYSLLGEPLSLLPGSYRARVNNTLAPFTIEGGRATTLTAGTVLATGTTSEYYYVLDTAGEQLGYALLGNASSYLPGTYTVRLNNRTTPIEVSGGDSTVVRTGTVVVEGKDREYYYVLDDAGTQLGYSLLGRPMSMLPGEYRVRVGERTDPVTVVANEETARAP
ncbi:MAG TPA: hypothetical protein VMN78_05895 [Longimicrobiales bacterium]|nr:hypothetical protein [Longimicrobiales bacterium]